MSDIEIKQSDLPTEVSVGVKLYRLGMHDALTHLYDDDIKLWQVSSERDILLRDLFKRLHG